MQCGLELLERLRVERFMQALGQRRTNTGDRAEEIGRLARTAQPLQICLAPGSRELCEPAGDSGAHPRYRLQRLDAARVEKDAQVGRECRNRISCLAIGSNPKRVVILMLQQYRRFPQPLGGKQVEGERPDVFGLFKHIFLSIVADVRR